MAFVDDLMQNAGAERIATLDSRAQIGQSEISGSVTATWVNLDENGLGVCEYNGKKYKTIRLGDTSLYAGDPVQLTGAGGVFYSDW